MLPLPRAPYYGLCLITQGFFLNALWIGLLWGWLVGSRRFPKDALRGGTPSLFHWAAALAAGGITLGLAIRTMNPEFWFLSLALANGVFLSVLNPVFALCFSVSLQLLRPWEVLQGHEFLDKMPRFSVIFTVAWALIYFCAQDRFAFRVSRATLMLLAFAAVSLASTFVAADRAGAYALWATTMIPIISFFLLIHHLARDRFAAWALKVTMIVALTSLGFISLWYYGFGYTVAGRIVGFAPFGNSNDIAAAMSLLLPLSLSPYLIRSSGLLKKLAALFPVSIALTALALAQSRGAILSIVAAVAAHALKRIRRKIVAVTAVAVIAACGQVGSLLIHRDSDDLQESSQSRQTYVRAGLRMGLHHPVIGVGFGQYPANLAAYADGFYESSAKVPPTAHNSWILALAEEGLLGLALFAGFYVLGIVTASRELYGSDPSLLYAAVSYGTAITFLSHTYYFLPYLLVALISVTAYARRSQAPASPVRVSGRTTGF